ncbi:hypothetical protein IV498_16735 [Paenarthrobacter sp. Z7-10]|uniref:hypothetical protein n=1 Tax=Paenarthrobacter sp. Z7-10 TaxID=2787635 RepID=UPI0022A969B5|nr:hypothetical protein [Paenarthrobacter sp. Z7-10]MCZ2404775.1 hypothetical protein [Paenarthrobacter sp. Z7-10]
MTDATSSIGFGSVRLIFEYSGGEINLVHQQRVDVAVPGFEAHPDLRPGHYVEVRDDGGASLVRVPVREDLAGSVEVFPENHVEPISRVERTAPHGAFTVVVPAPAAAHSIAVVRIAAPEDAAPPPSGGAASPTPHAAQVTDVATFLLDRTK